MAEKHITQVSQKIEWRVTEKSSQEFSRTESGILSALSELDEFFLSPQGRTFSVAVREHPGTANQKTGSPLNSPCSEVLFLSCCTSKLDDSDQEETHHMVAGKTEDGAPHVSHNFAVRTPLRHLKQTRFCWPFNNWRLTAILPISTTTSTEFQNCPKP